ncbi:Pycsar system effector family protein [Alienimonas chondri]|uniref:Pycsar effector protein domain-containing protein n=1 Tax=Alienimonas chondri TaxID=2681879 RepID=A0ABX1V830_9PLAN|nr:Pycsar system effector family protein [Alienimonas chondri]NNJ24325.1 hypothetical protein [Alienimonas chondri]
MNDKNSEPADDDLSFVWGVHSYLNEYIRFADAKAVVLAGWCVGILSYLHDDVGLASVMSGRANLAWFGWFSLGSVAVAVVGCACAVCPRLRSLPASVRDWWKGEKPQAGLIFWRDVLRHGSPAAYRAALVKASGADQVSALANHVYVLSEIADGKYRPLHWALLAAAASTITSTIFILSN